MTKKQDHNQPKQPPDLDDIVVVDPETPEGLGADSVLAPKKAPDPDEPKQEVIEPDAGPSS